MSTRTVRLNITLPADLVEELDRQAGTRARSRFIADAVKRCIEQNARCELDKRLEEGYKAMAPESMELTKEFESADLEGWDEY